MRYGALKIPVKALLRSATSKHKFAFSSKRCSVSCIKEIDLSKTLLVTIKYFFFLFLTAISKTGKYLWHSVIPQDCIYFRGAVVKWLRLRLNRKVGSSRSTMIRSRYLRVRQHYAAQKNNQKHLHVDI